MVYQQTGLLKNKMYTISHEQKVLWQTAKATKQSRSSLRWWQLEKEKMAEITPKVSDVTQYIPVSCPIMCEGFQINPIMKAF